MKNWISTIVFTALIIGLFSCKKEDDEIKPTPINNSYTKLEVGNYWIYENFEIDSNGTETPLNTFDSSYVEKDTLINGNKYAVLVLPDIIQPRKFLRDSLHYIVDSMGIIRFSSQKFNSELMPTHYKIIKAGDTLFSRRIYMTNKDSLVSVPAGDFLTYNYLIDIKYGNSIYAKDYLDRKINQLYAKNIGIIYNTKISFASAKKYTIQKLVRYKVQ